MMADTVTIPHLGTVKKSQAIAVGGVAAGIVVYAWWRSRATATDTTATDAAAAPADPFEGSFGTNGAGGDGSVSGYVTGSDTATTAPTTNAAWSDLVREKLADSYEPKVIDDALGAYLARQPLSTLDQTVIRAALARAGYPPVGTYSVVTAPPVGDTKIIVAPSGLKSTAVTSTTVTLSFNPVAGAQEYRLYRSGVSQNIGATQDTVVQAGGLTPNTSYTFYVAAGGKGEGTTGPRSKGLTVRTSKLKLSAPGGLKATPARTTIKVSCSKVSGATGYRWYINGVAHGSSDGTSYLIQGLHPNTTYHVGVAADYATGDPSPLSKQISVKTKK